MCFSTKCAEAQSRRDFDACEPSQQRATHYIFKFSPMMKTKLFAEGWSWPKWPPKYATARWQYHDAYHTHIGNNGNNRLRQTLTMTSSKKISQTFHNCSALRRCQPSKVILECYPHSSIWWSNVEAMVLDATEFSKFQTGWLAVQKMSTKEDA